MLDGWCFLDCDHSLVQIHEKYQQVAIASLISCEGDELLEASLLPTQGSFADNMCSEMESTLTELAHQNEDKADLLTKVKALIQQLSSHPMMGVKDFSQLFSSHDWQFLLSLDENIIDDAISSLVKEKDQMIQERKRMIQELRASKIEKEENCKNGPANPS